MRDNHLEIPEKLGDPAHYFKLKDTWYTAFATSCDALFFVLKHSFLKKGLTDQQVRPILALSVHIQWQRRTNRLITIGMRHIGTMDPTLGRELAEHAATMPKKFRSTLVVLGRECAEQGVPQWRIRLAHFPSRPLI
ncbi:MAG: hypothetical protein AAB400_02155 [Patescibacteria group bacterium]